MLLCCKNVYRDRDKLCNVVVLSDQKMVRKNADGSGFKTLTSIVRRSHFYRIVALFNAFCIVLLILRVCKRKDEQ